MNKLLDNFNKELLFY